jgi:DNA-binding transcriptional LysR family regulator
MDRLAAMQMFVKAVESGSLSGAARSLDQSLPAVSRGISALEKQLGARLLVRTTRRISLTESGRTYYERAKRVLGDLREAEAEVAREHSVPSGRLVISASVTFGRIFMGALIAGYLRRYPEVEVRVLLTDRYVDLVGEGVDVALRIGKLGDSALVARKLGEIRRMTVVAPTYLKNRDKPRHPEDLAGHDCLLFTYLAEPEMWRFRESGRTLAIPVQGKLRADNQDVILEAAVRGAGIAQLPSWLVRPYLQSGRLVPLLQKHESPPFDVNVVFPHARLLSAKTRAFVDHLSAEWRSLQL